MSNKNLELHIGDLVLDGLPYDQRQRVSSAVERELIRLLSESTDAMYSLDCDRNLPVHEVEVSTHWSPETIGRHVAQSTYQQIAATRSKNGSEVSSQALNRGAD